jgi:hypothetical protein
MVVCLRHRGAYEVGANRLSRPSHEDIRAGTYQAAFGGAKDKPRPIEISQISLRIAGVRQANLSRISMLGIRRPTSTPMALALKPRMGSTRIAGKPWSQGFCRG